MNAFGALGVGSGGFGPLYENGFVEILRIMINGWEDKQELVDAGITSFTEALIEKIEKIGGSRFNKILNFPITLYNRFNEERVQGLLSPINTDGEHASIQQDQSSSNTKTYNSVILTMSSNALEIAGGTIFTSIFDITVFPERVNTATRNLHMMRSSKLFIEVKTAFWKETTENGILKYANNIQSDELFRGLYCLDYKDKDGKGVILISYTWEDDSTKLLGLSNPEDRYQKFMRVLRAINPDFAAALDKNAITKTLDVGMIDWQKEAYYYGAFKLNYPGQDSDNHAAYFQPWGVQIYNIYLAGDSISFAGGWLEGPITSALNAVALLIKNHSSNSLRPESPYANISEDMYTYNPSLFKEFLEKDKASEK
jgi:tryptophan 2-monooxygenase